MGVEDQDEDDGDEDNEDKDEDLDAQDEDEDADEDDTTTAGKEPWDALADLQAGITPNHNHQLHDQRHHALVGAEDNDISLNIVMIVLELILKQPDWKEFSPLVQSSQKFWILKCALKEEASDLVSTGLPGDYPAVGSKVYKFVF